jgi:hypothetical protein
MSTSVCSHRGCCRPAPHGLGWGLSTGVVQWFCPQHFVVELSRLDGLLGAARAAAAARSARPQAEAAPAEAAPAEVAPAEVARAA